MQIITWIGRGLIVLVLALLFTGTAGYVYLRQSLPDLSGTFRLAGLHQPVDVVRDRNAVPHIFARDADDAYFALGFLHAQDRLWQMEINRHIAAGRLSEIFGAATLDTDKFIRTLGIRQFAAATYAHFEPATRAALDAYAAGVNAFIDNHSGPLPPEFMFFGIKPEPWTPVDSIAWIKMMAWDLGGNWHFELLRLQLAKKLSNQQIAEFLPPYPGDAPVALADLHALYRDLHLDATKLAAIAPPSMPVGAGSNEWVVSGKRSATGKPLLANDPHLDLDAPSVWYLAQINAPDLQVTGATLPGVPFVVLGHNARIAWGFTNTGPDVQDFFIEKTDPKDPGQYVAPDGLRRFEIRTETIKVKGGPDVTLKVRISRHGPVLSDVLKPAREALADDLVLAFQWTALADDDLTVQAGLNLVKATDWATFRAALRDFQAPQQNIVYADVDGNIGFIAPGRIPIRKAENDLHGLAPAPGWDAKYDWDGYVPFDGLPQSFNPASGKVVTANNKIVPNQYPYFITSEWAEPYRARRIEQLIAGREVHSIESFSQIQADVRSPMAADFLPLLLRVAPAGDQAAKAVELLRGWNAGAAANRPEPLIFEAWMRELSRLIYADELGDVFAGAWQLRPVFLFNVLTNVNGQSRWCDDISTAGAETCDGMIARALDLALANLRQRYGDNMSHWRWGDAHFARSIHRPFGNVGVLRDFFDLTVATPGDIYSIDVGAFFLGDEKEPFVSRHAPSLRAIYDLADLDRSLFMQSTGQSGNRLSRFYDNFVQPWANVEYFRIASKRPDIDPGAIGTLRLLPLAGGG